MITVTKMTPAVFTMTCAKCDTQFTYQLLDLRTNYLLSSEYVSCPTCGDFCLHRHREAAS